MRLTLLLDFLVYDNAQPTNDPANSIKVKKRVEEASISDTLRLFPTQIADATVDQSIPLPAASCDYLVLLTDQAISVKLNGSSTAQVLNPKAAGIMTPVLMIRGTITAMLVSNASGNVANLDISVVKI